MTGASTFTPPLRSVRYPHHREKRPNAECSVFLREAENVRRMRMQIVMIVSGVVALGLLIYLVVVLFKAEEL